MNLKAEGWRFFATRERHSLRPIFVKGNDTMRPDVMPIRAYFARESMCPILNEPVFWMVSLSEKVTADGIPYPMPPEAKPFWEQFGYEIPDSLVETITD